MDGAVPSGQTLPTNAAAKMSVVGKASGFVAGHAGLALAVIVVLAVLVIGLVVYYRGALGIGPYTGDGGATKPAKKDKKKKGKGADADTDTETERLLNSLNTK